MPNTGLGPPQNTEGKLRPVTMGSVPTYWGDDQILNEDGTWTKPTIQSGLPLHIPRTVRFLYAYDVGVAPLEADVVKCGCQGKNCTDINCAWNGEKNVNTQYYTSRPYVYIDGPSGIMITANGIPSVFISDDSGASRSIKVWVSWDSWRSGEPSLYDGPISGCPYLTKYYFASVSWTLDCTFTGSHGLDNGCLRRFNVNYPMGTDKVTDLTCTGSVVAMPDTPTSGGSDSLGNLYPPGSTISDYPPPELYEKACVSENDPCGE